MHSLLENYLSALAAQLQMLPKVRRDEELREMRAHLESAQAEHQQQGQTEDEAAASAIAQFGPTNALAQSVTQAWRRGKSIRRRELGLSAACTLLLAFLLPKLLFPLVKPLFLQEFHAHEPFWPVFIPQFLLVGLVNGFVLPRRAVAGTRLGMGIWTVCYLIVTVSFILQIARSSLLTAAHIISINLQNIGVSLLCWGLMSLVAMLGAWLGSRGRGRVGRLAGSR